MFLMAKSHHTSVFMIKHFFRISLRNMARSKVYSTMNIAGLAVGLAGFIVVLLYLNHELNYDKWSPELKKVYKVSLRSDEEVFETTAAPLAVLLAEKTSEIQTATRIQSGGDYEVPLSAGDTKLYATGSVEVDSNFLKVFPLEIVAGNRLNSLDKPNAVIISTELSEKLFGKSDPIGKTIGIYNDIKAEVTAVFAVLPGPSHLNIQFAWRSPWANDNNHWGNMSYETYIKTKTALPVEKVDAAINPIYYNERVKKDDQSYDAFRAAGHTGGLFADAVGSIHNFPRHGSTNFKTVAVLVVLAFLLLIAGAINFSNLSIAASIRRAKEVGIRKTLGSSRWQLVRQFLGETAMQCMISLVLALIIAQLVLPLFAKSFGIELSFFGANNFGFILLQILASLLIVIILSGLYPAVVLSLVNTNKVLKGEYSTGSKGRTLRNGLIVAQFVVAAFFVFAILVINKQIRFMETRDKGFSGQQVVRIEATQRSRDKNFEATRTALLTVPGVTLVSKSTKIPGEKFSDTSTFRFNYAGAQHRIASVKISADYFSTLDVKLVKGRLFDERQTDQQTRSAILNETAARKLGGDDVLGKPVFFEGCDTVPVQVVGIVRDFNVQGMETAVQPMIYTIGNKACLFQSGGAMLVKINSDKAAGTIAALTQVWKSVEPELPIRYSFLDDNFQRLFAAHVRLQQIISVFAIIAIVISIMGLFAMTAYLTGQRKKEIGVRKVLGASVSNLASLLSKDFIRLVVLSVIIAIPIGYWATNQWLDTFVYRINPGWPLFALAAGLVLLIAIITVGFQTIKAAKSNPVDSLRSE
jgi:putative ABC transport system permease protein